MARLNAANNAEATLVQAVSAADTTITVDDASVFPAAPFRLSINDEIVEVTEVAGNELTVERGKEGTAPAEHNAGDKAENRFTAGMHNELISQKEFGEHSAENATEAHDGISILNNNITVTVGDNGNYSTINDALNYLTTKYPAYKSGGNVTATIKLLSGFVMSEQVIVRGLDLGWIEIVGEDAETTIERSALTINPTIDDYGFNSFPAFGATKGGMLPIIGQLFVMDYSGDGALRHGVMAVDNSRATIMANCGVKNAGGNGVYATQASTIEARGADASGAGENGIFAAQASTINAINVNARKIHGKDSPDDIRVLNGSFIKIADAGTYPTLGGTNQTPNELTRNGIIFM